MGYRRRAQAQTLAKDEVNVSVGYYVQREVNDETCSDRRKRGHFGFNRLGGGGECTSQYQPERLSG